MESKDAPRARGLIRCYSGHILSVPCPRESAPRLKRVVYLSYSTPKTRTTLPPMNALHVTEYVSNHVTVAANPGFTRHVTQRWQLTHFVRGKAFVCSVRDDKRGMQAFISFVQLSNLSSHHVRFCHHINCVVTVP